MPRLIPVCSCAFSLRLLHTRPRVPASTRPSLRPLIFGGLRIREQLGRNAPREYEAMSIHVIASEAIVTAGAYGWIASLRSR
jgi:hypothetical protein